MFNMHSRVIVNRLVQLHPRMKGLVFCFFLWFLVKCQAHRSLIKKNVVIIRGMHDLIMTKMSHLLYVKQDS